MAIMAPAKQSASSYSSQDAVNSEIVTVGRSSMPPVRSLFAPVSSISTDNCKTLTTGWLSYISVCSDKICIGSASEEHIRDDSSCPWYPLGSDRPTGGRGIRVD